VSLGGGSAGHFLETIDTLLEVAFAPLADDGRRGIEPSGDLFVFEAGSGIEDDLGPDNVAIR